jgi:hypothetical protein
MDDKKCTKCGLIKQIELFTKSKKSKSGYGSWCKTCLNKVSRAIKRRKSAEYNKIRRDKYKENPTSRIESNLKWMKSHPENHRRTNCIWMKMDRKRNNEYYRIKGKEMYNKKKSTTKGRLNINISSAIGRSVRTHKGGRHWEDIVGYTLDQLKKHLEKKFQSWMSWDNYGQWHIDHIIPIKAFNYETPDDIDFKKCWALKNLQPLEAKENIRKSDNVNKPYQPSLLISTDGYTNKVA